MNGEAAQGDGLPVIITKRNTSFWMVQYFEIPRNREKSLAFSCDTSQIINVRNRSQQLPKAKFNPRCRLKCTNQKVKPNRHCYLYFLNTVSLRDTTVSTIEIIWKDLKNPKWNKDLALPINWKQFCCNCLHFLPMAKSCFWLGCCLDARGHYSLCQQLCCQTSIGMYRFIPNWLGGFFSNNWQSKITVRFRSLGIYPHQNLFGRFCVDRKDSFSRLDSPSFY